MMMVMMKGAMATVLVVLLFEPVTIYNRNGRHANDGNCVGVGGQPPFERRWLYSVG